ncbi:MAG: glycosyltransferase [Lachnospiraceae bacterium]|nr:glycosyltransferase [Lachnospiraceae bacterium]
MKAALFISNLETGGSQRVIVNIADYLITRGHQVTMVTQYESKNELWLNKNVKRVISDITAEEKTNSRIRNFYRRFMKLRRIWQSEQPDVILSFIGTNNLMAIMTTRFLAIPVAVSERGDPELTYLTKFLKFLARFLLRFANTIVLQTADSRKFFPPAVNRRAAILPNPVNPLFFRPRFEGEREKTIVAVGRVDENKNHRMLIQAFSKLADEYPDYQVIIYGEGDLRNTLISETAALGLAEKVHLPGKSNQIEEDIYRAGIYVLCSDTEGSPNSLIEAMLLGLPCIATDCPCGGPAELIEQGRNGLLIPPKDVNKMTENLQYLLENCQIAEEMGKNAHQLQAAYNPKVINEAWEKLLISLV